MKKFFKFFVFLLIVPLTFVFGGCKKDKDKNKGSGDDDTQIEQPVDPEDPGTGGEDPEDPDDPGTGGEDPDNPDEPGTGGEDPDNPDGPGTGGENPDNPDNPDEPDVPDVPDEPEPPAETFFTVAFDYSLPADYDFLLEDYSVEKNTKETVALPTIADARLSEYFVGWFDKTSNAQITTNISGTADQTKNVYAKWNVSDLKKYYYSTGVKFVQGVDYLSNPVAVVSDVETTAETVILPQVVDFDGTELPVRIFGEESFKNTNAKKIVMNGLEGLMINNSAFADSKIESFDFSKVYSIGDYAFSNSKLVSAEFGAFLTSVGAHSFENVSTLTSVDFSKATQINTVSEYMFNGSAKLATVKLGTAIKTVNTYAFAGCNKIVDTTFISAVTTLNNYAFASCDGLKTAVIPHSVISLGYNIFEGSENLVNLQLYRLPNYNSNTLSVYVGENVFLNIKKVEILGSLVTEIPAMYFANMIALEEIVIANSVVSIGDQAFGSCANLAKLNLPNSLDIEQFSFTSVSDTAWYNNLTDILYFRNDEVLLFVPASVSGEIVVKSGTKIIFDGAFINNVNITKVTIPSSVENIGQRAFEGCVGLQTVVFENNTLLTEIKQYTFFDCVLLKSINLEACSNLEKFGNFAFANIANKNMLNTFAIPSTIAEFGERVFSGANIKEFVVDADNEVFTSVDGVIYNKNISTLYFYPKLKEDVTFTIPETVSHIENYAFEYNKYINNLYIVNNVTTGNGGQTDLFNSVSAGKINIYSESAEFGIRDIKQPRVYRMLDESMYELIDYDVSTFVITAEASDITFTRYFIKFVNNGTEYIYRFTVSVSGETIEPSTLTRVFLFD